MNKRRMILKIKTTALAMLAGVFLFLVCLNFPHFTVIACCAQTPYPYYLTKTPQKDLLLSRFTTYFDGENAPRAHNIRLACRQLDGCKIDAKAEFSFNRTVGERTKERGFMDAAVIFEGQFVPGVGGGVCQVSTTLYNAALLSGMVVTEVRSHSLQVGYVAPSLDAMVSSSSDMKFINGNATPVVIRMRTDENSVTAEIYGRSTGYCYQTESVVLCHLPPPPPEIREGREDCVLRSPKDGLKSESYLVCYRRGKRLKSVRLRRDTYAFIQGIEQKKPKEPQDSSKEVESPEGRC
ncbi:MAG: VanW family protein [Clostridia bacterium]|nr:VanW family protein [Clostridia bacterium]